MKLVPEPVAEFTERRNSLLNLFWRNCNFTPTENKPNVWAVVMEIGYPEQAVSLVCLADGTTSLYFSAGGGIIGGGAHDQVREKVDKLFEAAEGSLKRLNQTKIYPLPEVERVRFYVRTYGETFTTQVNQANINNSEHELFPLFVGGHEVIAALREIDEVSALERI